MALIFHSKLSVDLSQILNDADDFNVIIRVGENKNTKEFHAHSVILRARSPYFKRAFSTEWIIKKDDVIMFNKPNITPIVFEMILKYIYTGELDLTKYQGKNILELLIASDELLLEELFNNVQEYLFENQKTWFQQNFVLVLHTVFKIANCKKLQDYCFEFICEDPEPFVTSEVFPSLDEDILFDLFKRDDFRIEEIIAWDCLIKWGIEQTPGLGSENNDRTKWNNEEYESLKETLKQFIPIIRFVEISSKDYYDKVRPYKAIIPNKIYEEIEEFYFKSTLPKTTTLPPRIGKSYIESKIIRLNSISIITNWIDKKDSNDIRDKNDLIYKFELIYRGSKDGINNNSCNNKCNLQEPVLILIKCKNLKKIFGGYSSVGFYHHMRNEYQNKYITSDDNFVFSFEGKNDIQNMKLGRVISNVNVVYNNYFGDCGFDFGGGDLNMQNDNLYIKNSNYQHTNNNGIYIIEEIEAFRKQDFIRFESNFH
uniref:Serine-enriched protein n=1 Tax=Rhizophagus irregularis (strain DAOM 181602 / DAOM 197198 / MUCL 43194) TaxID=747089 RepID=U9SQM2_RHIID